MFFFKAFYAILKVYEAEKQAKVKRVCHYLRGESHGYIKKQSFE